MLSKSAEWLANLRLMLCQAAVPFYVRPREYFLSWLRTLLRRDQPAFPHLLANATVRWLSTTLSLEQFHSVTGNGPRISDHIDSCPKLQELGAKSREIVGNDFRATYVARVPGSTHLILYVHGGGFVSGSSMASGKYLLQLFLELEHKDLLCDILSVDYDLSPGALYPTALRQVVNAYRYATAKGKQIILMGDSAGGNLCLGLLQHLALPNLVLETSTEHAGNGEIVAMCLLSPWVNLRTEGDSVRRYKQFDCVNKAVLDGWARHYLGPSGTLDCYNNPIEREEHWGTILPKKSLILAGGVELFLSDIIKLANKAQTNGKGALELIITPMKGHAWAALDYGFFCSTRPLGVGTEDGRDSLEGFVGLRLQADWIAKAVVDESGGNDSH